MPRVKWLEKTEAHDFPAAADYLAMLADAQTVKKVIKKLKAGTVAHKKAKDILRAAQLGLLPDGYHRVCANYHTDENTAIPVILAVARR